MTKFTRRTILKTALAAPLAMGATAAMAATHQVAIQGFAFVPANLTIAAGDTVVFTNADGAPHTATALNGAFDTGRLRRNQAGEITVSAAGSYEYKCLFHPAMKGTITVS